MGVFERLRKHKPIIHTGNPEEGGHNDPRFHPFSTEIPAKWIPNTRNDMSLLRLYTHGALKYEETGVTCENCVNFYYDAGSRYGGRCRAYGFRDQHPDTPADDRAKGWTHPVDGFSVAPWPGCPQFTLKERLSRR
mgnify:CR=1 FL=1